NTMDFSSPPTRCAEFGASAILHSMFFAPTWRFRLEAETMARKMTPVPFFAAFALLIAYSAAAQPLGNRAQGMAGAFVAVADDATSVYWNPAGMATGALVSFVVDYGDGERRPDRDLSPEGGGDTSARMVALTLPPLGLSYYRLGSVVAGPRVTVGTAGPDRQEGGRDVHGLRTSNVGLTLAQSISRYVVVATTVRYVRGTVTAGFVPDSTVSEALDAASGLPEADTSRADLDAGLMVAVERLRLGVVARNLRRPGFDV